MNNGTSRVGKRAAEEDVDGPPFKRKRPNDAASRMRDHIDFGEGSSMTGSQSMDASSLPDPLSNIVFEEEDLVLPFETPWNGRDSKQPVRYLRNYRILGLKSQEDFCMSSIQHASLEFEEQEELPHFLGFVRYKACEPEERMARNHEFLILSSKVWRAWWDRDPDTSERYVLRFLTRHRAKPSLEAIGYKHNSQLIFWKSPIRPIRSTTTTRQC
jgi:hypothetical protein